MVSAYKILFEIETTLKSHIEITLKNTYGLNWKLVLREKKEFDLKSFHELVSYFGKYPPLTNNFTDEERMKLYQINNIRNKIAHMQLITHDEFEELEHIKKIINKRLLLNKSTAPK